VTDADSLTDLLAAQELSSAIVVLIAVLAFLVALWGTNIARAAAIRFGIVDHPDGGLKRHREPTPYLGGLAVFGGVLVSLLLVFDFRAELLGLLLAAELVLLVGLIDDLGVLTPGVKLAGQLLAVWVLIKADVTTHLMFLPWWGNALLTAFWLVAVMNAVNIIDIMDGLATSVVATAACVLVVIALVRSDLPVRLREPLSRLDGRRPDDGRPLRRGERAGRLQPVVHPRGAAVRHGVRLDHPAPPWPVAVSR